MSSDVRPLIFVSATSRDLRSCRQRVKEALLTLGCIPVEQQNFPPNASTVREMLRARLKTCHAVIHLAGLVYGAEPTERAPGDPRRSYTQLEVDIARELGIPVYVFVCGDDFPFDPHDPEPGELQELQRAHRRALVSGDGLYEVIPHPEALERRVLTLQDRVELLRREIERSTRRVRVGLSLAAAAVVLVGWLVFRQGGQLEEANEATKRVESSTVRIEATVGDIAAGFARIDRGGGLIANPTRPEEHYHNALVFEQRGDAAKARTEYLAFARSGVNAIDASLRLAHLIETWEGRTASRELFRELSTTFSGPALGAVYALQFDGEERLEKLLEFVRANPSTCFSARYLLANAWREDEINNSGLLDRLGVIQGELRPLEEFIAAQERGVLKLEFIDLSVLEQWLSDARLRVSRLRLEERDALSMPLNHGRTPSGADFLLR